MKTIREIISENQVLDLGPLPAPRLGPGATVQQGLQFLVRGRRGAIVIVEDLRPLGVFSERDVVYGLPEVMFTSREQRSRIALRDVMSSPPVTVRRQETLRDAIGKMVERQLRHLVVVDRHENLKGLLTSNDLVQFLTDQFPEDTVNLPPRLHQVYHTAEGG